MGLKDDFKNAPDEATLAALHVKGQSFEYATPRTRRQWGRLDHARRDQLAKARATAEQAAKPKKAKAVKA